MPEIRKGKIGNFIRGADTWLHGQQMFFFSFAWLVLLGLLLATALSLIYIWLSLDKCTLSNSATYYWAQLKGLIHPYSSIAIGECVPLGSNSSIPLKLVMEEQFFKGAASQVSGQFGWAFLASFILYTPLGAFLAIKAAKRGKEIKEDKFIRGAKLVSVEELKKEVADKHGLSDLTIGDFPLPVGFAKKHTLISGTTGAGKSTALTHLLKAIRARGDRAVVYDKKGEFVEKFYRDGVDHILNPSDSRSHQWTPWEEMASPFDADWIAETLIPENKSNGGDPFFRDSPRHVFSAALQKLYLDGFRSLSTLLQATAWSDLELLTELVAGTPAETHFSEGNEKTLASIRSTLVNGVLPLRLLKESDSRGFFSIRDWIAQGDEQGADDSWLFLPVRESDIEIQKPLISTWIQSVAKGLMARGVNNDRTLWLIVDELPSLKRIPALSMLMAEGRGFGAAVVLGIQEINQLEEEFGKNTSRTILGLCSTQLHFRLNNADTAEWVSKVLGEAEREEIDEDLNYSADDIRDGVRVSSKRQSRKIVLPSEIMDLPDLSCYAKIWGVEGKARIDVPFLPLPPISEGFIQGDENETVGMRLLNAARASKGTVPTESAPNEQTIETEGLGAREESQEEPSGNAQQEVQKILDSVGMDNDSLYLSMLGDKKS
ncbi:type IV secretion system DNA-binding domain-containing protein [Salinimonas chungwhensis]|uniref:type IV secretion system DNA-binding domain-containing protein n=1 Tax=Salinimonas chungwhensis TaxID=265425 RepID=UPI00035EFBBD|nr:type IV secretion system DNA-binding domain-containing protein [Salinimonas chungwhensis]